MKCSIILIYSWDKIKIHRDYIVKKDEGGVASLPESFDDYIKREFQCELLPKTG